MKDRRGHEYLVGFDLRVVEVEDGGVKRTEEQPVATHVLSEARQADKVLKLSGRQLRKYRKWRRREVAQIATVAYLEGMINPNDMGGEHAAKAEGNESPAGDSERSVHGSGELHPRHGEVGGGSGPQREGE